MSLSLCGPRSAPAASLLPLRWSLRPCAWLLLVVACSSVVCGLPFPPRSISAPWSTPPITLNNNQAPIHWVNIISPPTLVGSLAMQPAIYGTHFNLTTTINGCENAHDTAQERRGDHKEGEAHAGSLRVCVCVQGLRLRVRSFFLTSMTTLWAVPIWTVIPSTP